MGGRDKATVELIFRRHGYSNTRKKRYRHSRNKIEVEGLHDQRTENGTDEHWMWNDTKHDVRMGSSVLS